MDTRFLAGSRRPRCAQPAPSGSRVLAALRAAPPPCANKITQTFDQQPTMTADRDDCGQLDHPQACRTGGGQAADDLHGGVRPQGRHASLRDGLRPMPRRVRTLAHAAIVCGERARGWVCHGMEGVAAALPRQIWQSSASLASIGLRCGVAPLYAETYCFASSRTLIRD
jgi:hypothetical protein